MYEKDGDKYFVVDSHSHFWDASEENWVPGAEQYAKGWIDCFYGYHKLGPPETHWDWNHFLKVTEEDFVRDVFEEGHVDVTVFQSTYLREWYRTGFNTLEQNNVLVEKYKDRLLVNARWDPREGDAGLRQFEEDVKRYGCKGVKLYTAEWRDGSRGWTLRDPEAFRFLEKTQELGIKNVHVHKGPTIWPLDKDAFDVRDVDTAATSFTDLNFIVEHVGLPRIEDFCFMAVQEPNVYAGLSVVVGGLMHARPKFFAKVMGELLFWVGEDKMLFGGDYNIWTPKWQVEGLVDWQMPDEEQFSDYPRLTVDSKRKILGLNAARLYDLEVPAECRLSAGAAVGDADQPGEELVSGTAGDIGVSGLSDRVYAALDTVRDPELDESVLALDFVSSVAVSEQDGIGSAEVHLRLPTFFCAPNFAFLMVADAYDATMAVDGVSRASIVLDDHFASHAINEGVAARAGFVESFGGEAQNELEELRTNFLNKAALAGQDRVARPLLSAGWTPEQLSSASLGDLPPSPDLERLRDRRRLLGLPAGDGAPLLTDAEGVPVTLEAMPLHLRRARTTRVGMEANGGYCRSLLADRYQLGAAP